MKRTVRIFAIIILGIISSTLTSCLKKGKEDPVVSFHTRKARVTGDWKAKSGTVLISNYSFSASYTIDGTTYNYSDPSGYASGTAIVSFNFKRNGDADISINVGGYISVLKGSWDFTDGVGDMKRKSQLIIHPTFITDGNGSRSVEGNEYYITYDIIELKNKEMHLHLLDKQIYSSTNFDAYTEDWILVQ